FDHAFAQRADGAVGRSGSHRGVLSQAGGCWTFNARDRMPRSSRLPVHAITAAPKNPPASTPPSRKSGFVPCPSADLRATQDRGRRICHASVEWAASTWVEQLGDETQQLVADKGLFQRSHGAQR